MAANIIELHIRESLGGFCLGLAGLVLGIALYDFPDINRLVQLATTSVRCSCSQYIFGGFHCCQAPNFVGLSPYSRYKVIETN